MNSLISKVLVVLVLLVSSGAGGAFYLTQDSSNPVELGGFAGVEFLWTVIYIACFIFLLPRFRSYLRVLILERSIALLILLAFCSMLWSVDAGLTLRRSVALLGTSMLGLTIAVRFSLEEQLKMLASALGITALASLVTCTAVPSVGVMQEGQWQGIFFLKGSLGRMMALGYLSSLILVRAYPRIRIPIIGIASLYCALILLSRGVTAALATIFFSAILPFQRLLDLSTRRLRRMCLLGSLALGIISCVLVVNRDNILDSFSKDPSLTGRKPLWHLLIQDVKDRPWLGYGYGAFWASFPADRIRRAARWDVPNAHCGYLEMTLAMGAGGWLVLTSGLTWNLYRAFRYVRNGQECHRLWPLSFLIFILFYNVTESSIPSPNTLLWIEYTAISVSLALTSDGRRDRPAAERSSSRALPAHELVEV